MDERLEAVKEHAAQIAATAVDMKVEPTEIKGISVLAAPDGDGNDVALEYRSHVEPLTATGSATLANRLHIPFEFYERMRLHYPTDLENLVYKIIHRELHKTDKPILVRTIKRGEKRVVRALLSHTYKPFDHPEAIRAIEPTLESRGLVLQECNTTDEIMRLAFRPSGIIEKDRYYPGMTLTNSETGFHSTSVQVRLFKLVCTNGMMHQVGRDRGNRKIHRGLGFEQVLAQVGDYANRVLDTATEFAELTERLRGGEAPGWLNFAPGDGVQDFAVGHLQTLGLMKAEAETMYARLSEEQKKHGYMDAYLYVDTITNVAKGVRETGNPLRADEMEAIAGGQVSVLATALDRR